MGVPLESTLANDPKLLRALRVGSEQILRRPIETARLTGPSTFFFASALGSCTASGRHVGGRLEELEIVAACLLGAIHCCISVLDQRLHIRSVFRVDADTDAAIDSDMVPINVIGQP
jgi:hypothetical protein